MQMRRLYKCHKKVRKYLLIAFILIINVCLADGPTDHIVLKENGINLMEKPNDSSKVLKHLPFGTIIKCWPYSGTFKYEFGIPDTIENISGYWLRTLFDNLTGYVFSPYVYINNEWLKVDTVINESTIRLASEGYFRGNINYNPHLFWYGLYRDSTGFYLKPVKVHIAHSHIDQNQFLTYQPCEEEGIWLETDNKKESIFLIGVGKEWKEGRMYNSETIFNEKVIFNNDDGFLYPEREIRMWYGTSYIIFKAYDSLIVDSQCNIKKMYQLEFIRSDHKRTDKINLNKYLNINGPGNYYSEHQSPKIHWVGDINQDGDLDFITYQSDIDNQGSGSVFSLFMFDAGSNSNPILKVSTVEDWSCE